MDPLATVRARLRDTVPRAMPLDGTALAWLRDRLALTATEELRRNGGKLGLATMCIGVGQGIALALERV